MPDGVLESQPKGGFEFFGYEASMVGTIASQALCTNGIGRVIAVFDRSFYVELDTGLVCVGGVDLPIGPLNIITTAPTNMNWRASGVRVDDRAFLFEGHLRIGRRFRFDLTESAEWSPGGGTECWTARSVEHGLAGFREASSGCVPADGIGAFIHGDDISTTRNAVQEKARKRIISLRRWLTMTFSTPEISAEIKPYGLEGLLGLGPGLTPSGDDFLGGMMIAARSLGEVAVCRRLWDLVRPITVASGNRIVFAHLSAASKGTGGPGIHRAIEAIMIGQSGEFDSVVRDIGAIGHTSGWDTMAGVTRLLEAWLQAR
jgi:hypothetical protein